MYLIHFNPRDSDAESRGFLSFVIPNAYIVPWETEGVPRDVEPAGTRKELVGMFTTPEEVDEALKQGWIFGANVGSLAQKVLGIPDATDLLVDLRVAEARVDDDGTTDGLACRLQELAATIGHTGNLMDGGNVLGVFLQVAELSDGKMG